MPTPIVHPTLFVETMVCADLAAQPTLTVFLVNDAKAEFASQVVRQIPIVLQILFASMDSVMSDVLLTLTVQLVWYVALEFAKLVAALTPTVSFLELSAPMAFALLDVDLMPNVSLLHAVQTISVTLFALVTPTAPMEVFAFVDFAL